MFEGRGGGLLKLAAGWAVLLFQFVSSGTITADRMVLRSKLAEKLKISWDAVRGLRGVNQER